MKRLLALAAALLVSSCRGGTPGQGSPGPGPTGSRECDVPEGYRGLPWGLGREEVLRRNPDLKPSAKDPSVLVRTAIIAGAPAREAFLFDHDGLASVEVSYQPRRTPQESATLILGMDRMFCPHDVTLADDYRYQVAWEGNGTDLRLTYDMREATPFGPVVSYGRRVAAATATATPGPSPSTAPPKQAGPAFAAAVKAARARGEHLALVESPRRGDLALLYESASGATEIRLTSDPATGKLLGAASLPAAPAGEAGQLRAEAALDKALANGGPVAMSWKSSALTGLVNLTFPDGGWILLDPRAPDALAGAGRSGK